MKRRVFTSALLATFLHLAAASNLRAQIVSYTWSGAHSGNDSWQVFDNWVGGVVPLNDGVNTRVFFGSDRHTDVSFGSEFIANVNQLTISGNSQGYYFNGTTSNDLTIGSGGLVYSPAQPVRSTLNFDGEIDFTASQTWNIASGTLVLQGLVYDGDSGYTFTKTGAGTLVLGNSDNEFDTSIINLNDGRLVVKSSAPSNLDQALGSGAVLNIGPTGSTHPVLVANEPSDGNQYSLTLSNNINLNGSLVTEDNTDLHLTGTITLNQNTTVSPKGDWLFLEGPIVDGPTSSPAARKLTVDTTSAVVLSGTNTYSGGTDVLNGVLIFAKLAALPASPATNALTMSATGYIGMGDDGTSGPYNLQTAFLDRFNKAASFGTIGLDTDLSLPPTNFTGSVDLTGFATSAQLGSATHAILSGTITPQGTDYRFGGGGGVLQVDSALTGARALMINSPAARPLTLLVTNSANNYSGGTSVTNSGLILGNSDSNASLPSGSGAITINTGGYVGFRSWGDLSESNGSLMAASLAKINPASIGMVGFDQISTLTGAINLSSFPNALYLGTATQGSSLSFVPGLTLTGTITTTNGGIDPYRFAGYKGGWLEVASSLTGSAGVKIGDPSSPGTFADFHNKIYSTVALSGNNTGLTGNVTLYGGQLMIGQSNGVIGLDPTNAFGSGTLVVAGMSLPPEWVDENGNPLVPQLDTSHDGLILPNNISLGTTLQIGDSGNQLLLSGQITGSGGLYLEDGAWLTLSNNTNSFSGGIYLSSHNFTELDIDADHATGTGPLSFGNSNYSNVYFDTAAPVIGGLVSKLDTDYAKLFAEMPNTVLTINQSINSQFQGEFHSDDPGDALRIVKTGTGLLRLESGGMYYHNGTVEASLPLSPLVSLQVNQGTVVLSQNFIIEDHSPVLWVHGGTLALDNASVYNPLVVDNGGRLAGNGYFYHTPVTIGAGATVAPGHAGMAEIGLLQFAELNLAGGGAYEWNIQNPTQANGGSDLINVFDNSTLDLSSILLTDPADSAHRFTLKVISLKPDGTPGLLSGFDPSQSYSWTIFTYQSLNAYNPNKILIDTTQFANSLSFNSQGNGAFSLSLGANQIFLNFTPVPEPSTYALMLVGLGGVGLPLLRRRRG